MNNLALSTRAVACLSNYDIYTTFFFKGGVLGGSAWTRIHLKLCLLPPASRVTDYRHALPKPSYSFYVLSLGMLTLEAQPPCHNGAQAIREKPRKEETNEPS